MADTIWKAKYKGKPYTVTTADLTVLRLRLMKSWFGKEYGAFSPFIVLLAQGDVDAMACVLWIAQQKEGEKPREPRELDFSIDDFETLEDEEPAEEPEEDPTAPPESSPTTDSQPTSEPSEADTSST